MQEMNGLLPRARTEGLVRQEVEQELVVYDTKRDETHLLNRTAALVWEECDGKHTIATLAINVAKVTNTAPNQELVRYTLALLQRKGLLAETIETGVVAFLTRRQFLGKFALAAGVVPIIHSLKAPNADQVASCSGIGSLCGTGLPPCCPPLVCGALAPFCIGN